MTSADRTMRLHQNWLACILVLFVTALAIGWIAPWVLSCAAKDSDQVSPEVEDLIIKKFALNTLKCLENDAILFIFQYDSDLGFGHMQSEQNYRRDVTVIDVNRLDDPAYLKSLRDGKPKPPVFWTEEQIDHLEPIRKTNGSGIIRIRDLAISHIVRHSVLLRPLYFSVTVPPEVYADYRRYMEFEGLVYRLVPKEVQDRVNVEHLERNLWKYYDYAGIMNDRWQRVYRGPLTQLVRGPIINYATAFTELGFARSREREYAKAVKAFKVALGIYPDFEPALRQLGWCYLKSGDTTRAIQFYKEQIRLRPDQTDFQYGLAGIYEQIGDLDAGLEILDGLLKTHPDHRDAAMGRIGICIKSGKTDKARKYLIDWLKRHPDDVEMKKRLDDLGKGH
jgi:tetratricopeptide (TPR) repeat protein